MSGYVLKGSSKNRFSYLCGSVYTPHQSKAYTEDYQLASLWHSVFANVDSWFVIYFIDGYIFKLVLRVLKVLFKS